MKIDEIWSKMQTEQWPDGRVQRVLLPASPIDLYLAIEPSSGKRMFVFGVEKALAFRSRKLGSSLGLDVRQFSSKEYGEGKLVTEITLSDLRYKDLFDILVEDICQRCSLHVEKTAAHNALLDRIQQWQKFFSRSSAEGMSKEQQRGLYGELYFLRILLFAGVLNVSGLGCWRGPSGAEQDFQFPKIAVEQKVSLAAQNQELIISSERQLEVRGFDRLFLSHLSLLVKYGSGETLCQIVDSIVEALPIGLRDDFLNLLFEVGYIDGHRAHYEEVGGYIVREKNFFEVTDSFPKIIESDLPNGVGKVRYAISVPVCKKFLIDEGSVLEAIRASYES